MALIKSAEELGQRALDVNIIDEARINSVWSELGSRNVSLGEFQQALLRRNLLTNYQLDRLQRGLRTGFFYGDYKVLYNVGSGTFARVFRTTHRSTNELFAVKVLRNRFSNPMAVADPNSPDVKNADIIELFRREGELGAALHHPNIVPIHEVFSKGLIHYIAMEFIEGRNLREFYRARRRFDPFEAARIMEGVVAGLSYAFQKGVTHRDLKMSNVLLSSDGVAKLVDFGLAGLDATYGSDSAAGKIQRTIDYAGLERATGVRKDDTRSDIFFAGCIFYQLLCGRPALVETDRAQRLNKSRYQEISPILEMQPDLPLPLAIVVNKAIEFDPERRYRTPSDMLTELKLAMKRAKNSAADEAKTMAEEGGQEGVDENGQPRRLMVVEADGRMQDVFRELFKKNGYRVLVSSDPHRALQRFFDDHQAADLILFSTVAVGQPALNIFNQFGQEARTRDLPAVLLLAEQHGGWEDQADVSADHRVVAKMPIKPRQLRELLVDVTAKRVG